MKTAPTNWYRNARLRERALASTPARAHQVASAAVHASAFVAGREPGRATASRGGAGTPSPRSLPRYRFPNASASNEARTPSNARVHHAARVEANDWAGPVIPARIPQPPRDPQSALGTMIASHAGASPRCTPRRRGTRPRPKLRRQRRTARTQARQRWRRSPGLRASECPRAHDRADQHEVVVQERGYQGRVREPEDVRRDDAGDERTGLGAQYAGQRDGNAMQAREAGDAPGTYVSKPNTLYKTR